MVFLQGFQKLLVSMISYSIRNPKKIIFFLFTLIVICIGQAKPFKLLITIDELLNKSYQTYQEYSDLKEDFEVMPSVFVIIKKQDSVLNEADLCHIRGWRNKVNFNTSNIYYSISPITLRKTSYVKEQNGEFPKLLFNPLLRFNCDLPRTDNSILSPIATTPWKKIFSNDDYSDFGINITFSEKDELNFQSKVIPQLVRKMKIFWSETEKLYPELKAYFIGEASYHQEMSDGLKKNFKLNIIISVIIIILFKAFLGTWSSSLIFLGTLILSTGILFGLMSLTGTPIDILNNALFLLLTVSSMGDFIFLSNFQSRNPDKHWKEAFLNNALPSFLTSLTTFVGFISLYSSDLDIVKRLGLWAAVSGVIEWIVIFLVLPAFLTFLKSDFKWIDSQKVFKIISINWISKINFPRKLTYLLLVAYLFIPYSLNHLNVSDVPLELFEKKSSYRVGMEYLKESRGYSGDVSLVFKDFSDEEFNQEVLSKIKALVNVVKIESPYLMLSYFTEGLSPLNQKVVRRSLRTSPSYKRLISEPEARAIIYLKSTDLKSINDMRIYVNEELCTSKRCHLSGLHVAYADFSQEVPKTLLRSFKLSLAIVFMIILTLSFMVKNIPVFKLSMTTFWGVAIVICIMSVFQIKINFITCVVISTLVGLTGDNAIHFILNGIKGNNLDQGIDEKSEASIITAIIMSITSLTFLFSCFNPPKVFGVLLFVGFLLSLLGDLYMLKSIMRKSRDL
ncbi:hypothetical protein A9Q84_19695 [Halobacteriovorax marinus]|uniref:Membrane transport protein MMPL domain-containing protein n=1 Tax=Halobacteriovorax marinus TaxID=97084 RepID=A0A1Y5F6K5_9BACT|nr:hypothetical protein A9Q84_19695 [Halobacteriovorax marinus]